MREVSEKEVRTAVFQMGVSRASRPDEFPCIFYRRLSEVVGDGVLTAVK